MPPAIFIDFDGTIVPYDVEFELFAHFGGPTRAGDVVARGTVNWLLRRD